MIKREESTILPPPKLSQHYEEAFSAQPSSLPSKPKVESNTNEVSRIEVLNSLVSNNHQEDANNSKVSHPSKLSLSKISNTSEKKKIKRLKPPTKKNLVEPNKDAVQNEYYPMKENENPDRKIMRKRTLAK